MQADNLEARQLPELHKSRAYEKCKFTIMADRLSTRHGSGAHEKGELVIVANRLSAAQIFCLFLAEARHDNRSWCR